jgi:hypothetical protein
MSVPRTPACRPYLESFAIRIASCSESCAMTHSTGPKISVTKAGRLKVDKHLATSWRGDRHIFEIKPGRPVRSGRVLSWLAAVCDNPDL